LSFEVPLSPEPARHRLAAIGAGALALASALAPDALAPGPGRAGWLRASTLAAGAAGDERPLRDWRLVDGKQWQLVAPAAEEDAAEGDDGGGAGPCPRDMVEARGAMKLDGAHGDIEDLQTRACSVWTDHPEPRRCAAFDAARWAELSRNLSTRPMHFCIDRFEYPDRRGEYPLIMVNWREAAAHCADAGKRLCTEDEWTFACEGEEARPYATGFVRDAQACVIDRPWRLVHPEVFGARTGERVLRELDELWQGEPAGSHPRCVSPFGAYDMTGNVDEWTVTSSAKGLRSILKGGYWGPIHARCRTSTRVHNEDFHFYQIGLRCCAPVAAVAPVAGPAP
jgi:sulfatase modifying factor 1